MGSGYLGNIRHPMIKWGWQAGLLGAGAVGTALAIGREQSPEYQIRQSMDGRTLEVERPDALGANGSLALACYYAGKRKGAPDIMDMTYPQFNPHSGLGAYDLIRAGMMGR